MSWPGYNDPIILCANVAGTGLQTAVLDIGNATLPGYPPVVQFVVTGGATNVQLLGGHQLTGTTTVSVLNAFDVTGGGITAATADHYDLIPGIRFYQVNITANNGSVTVLVGAGPTAPGVTSLVKLVGNTNNNNLN